MGRSRLEVCDGGEELGEGEAEAEHVPCVPQLRLYWEEMLPTTPRKIHLEMCPGVILQQNVAVVLIVYVVPFACLCLDTWEVPFEEISELQWLGSGAQGAVFLGKFRAEEVAIKKVRDQNETDIKHLRKLKHPNIIAFK